MAGGGGVAPVTNSRELTGDSAARGSLSTTSPTAPLAAASHATARSASCVGDFFRSTWLELGLGLGSKLGLSKGWR